jgi:hypothetical protein
MGLKREPLRKEDFQTCVYTVGQEIEGIDGSVYSKNLCNEAFKTCVYTVALQW